MASVVHRRPILHTSCTVSGASESSLWLRSLGLGHLSLSVVVDVPSGLETLPWERTVVQYLSLSLLCQWRNFDFHSGETSPIKFIWLLDWIGSPVPMGNLHTCNLSIQTGRHTDTQANTHKCEYMHGHTCVYICELRSHIHAWVYVN